MQIRWSFIFFAVKDILPSSESRQRLLSRAEKLMKSSRFMVKRSQRKALGKEEKRQEKDLRRFHREIVAFLRKVHYQLSLFLLISYFLCEISSNVSLWVHIDTSISLQVSVGPCLRLPFVAVHSLCVLALCLWGEKNELREWNWGGNEEKWHVNQRDREKEACHMTSHQMTRERDKKVQHEMRCRVNWETRRTRTTHTQAIYRQFICFRNQLLPLP